VDCVVQARIYRSSISLDLLRRSLGLPRRRSTSPRWNPRAFWISCALCRPACFRWVSRAFRWSSPCRWNSRAFWISRTNSRPTSCRWNSCAFVVRRATSVTRASCWPSSRRWNIPAFSGFSALSVDLRRVAGIPALSSIVGPSEFPRLRRSAGSSLDLPRLLPGISRVYDLPRLSRWSYIIIELFCVTRLNLSGLSWYRAWCWRSEQWRKSGQNIYFV